MGYYANGNGDICFNAVLDEKTYEAVLEVLRTVWECDGEREFKGYTSTPIQDPYTYIDVWTDDKYYDDEVINALNTIKEMAPVGEYSSIKYRGEDEALWRFVFKDGEWIEQEGRIVYE